MTPEHGVDTQPRKDERALPRRVLVGFDGSTAARAALGLAGRRAGPGGEVVVVYSAALPPNVVLGMPDASPLPEPPEELGRRILSEAEDLAAGGGPRVRTVLRTGPAGGAILDVARERDADEIVVGSRGLGRFRALLGSTSHWLVHEADRPVVVVTERGVAHAASAQEPARLLVVGYDGSEDARDALDYARRHLAPGGEVLAVHAYRAPPEWKGTPFYDAALAERVVDGERLLDGIRDLPGVSCELIAEPPAVALAAVAAARDADEIVVGSRGHGTLRATLGSVAHAVLHEADRPVVIVPRRPARRPAGD